MLLILLSFIYIFFTTINLGLQLENWIQIKKNHLIITSIFGLFLTTILASFWAIFGRINIEFQSFLLLLNILFFFKNKSQFTTRITTFVNQIKALEKNSKILLSIITVLIISQCGTSTYLVDNESYYIQTIKWLNEYGFVNGLANLHIFLAQQSGWHITQSAFNFSFFYKNFNDLSGYILLLANAYSFIKLDTYYKTKNQHKLIIGLVPFLNLFLFRFISSPSPDVPVYLISFLIFYLFIKDYKKTSVKTLKIILLLSVFMVYIKTTSFTILLLSLYLLLKNKTFLSKKIVTTTLFCIVIFALFVYKNFTISGYPFYPLKLFSSTENHKVPFEILNFFMNETRVDGFYITQHEFQNSTYFQIAKKWFFSSIIDGFFNLLSIVTLLVFPIYLWFYSNQKKYWIFYFITIIHFVIMFLTSPQYRYFIHYIFILDFIIIVHFINQKTVINWLNYMGIAVIAFLLIVPVSFAKITTNNMLENNSIFKIDNLIFPTDNSKYKPVFSKQKIGNLNYNAPENLQTFWLTSNGELPCANKEMLEYFKKYLHYIPQQNSPHLKDGFYSKKVTDE